MIVEILAFVALGLALVPCTLFLVNLLVYRRLPAVRPGRPATALSVLIPARNEEGNIRSTLETVLKNANAEFEVVVLDDHSTDSTREIVEHFAARDSRVRLVSAPPLPPGWCGKQRACHLLATHARHPLLVFVDADVKLASDALSRISDFMDRTGAALASGVPKQETCTFSEKLLLPFIHHVLLCYLPMHAARRSKSPAFAAGCGQLMVARADAYSGVGGHGAIRASLHDGIMLPRAFRKEGFRTELFDATDIATCRMYKTNGEVWSGLGKNATEGMASPGTILPMTGLLLGGNVLPAIMCAAAPWGTPAATVSFIALALSFLPRLVGALRFRQSFLGVMLHPLGVVALLAIQWNAFGRRLLGKPSEWKGRAYPAPDPFARTGLRYRVARTAILVIALAAVAVGLSVTLGEEQKQVERAYDKGFELSDQHGELHKCEWAASPLTVLVIADAKGAEKIDAWIVPLRDRFGSEVRLLGVANVSSVPSALRSMVQGKIKKRFEKPVMLDWEGVVVNHYALKPSVPNIFIIGNDGKTLNSFQGAADPVLVSDACSAIYKNLRRGA